MQDSSNRDPSAVCERFLDQVSVGLSKEVSVFERDDTIKEMRSHLLACAAAFEELGLTPYDAMAAAIDRFGDAATIQSQLLKEHRKGSHRHVSQIVTVGSGAIFGAILMVAADCSLVWTHTVGNRSLAMAPIGMVVGGLIGASLYKRPRTPLVAALRSGLIVPTSMMLLVCLRNRQFPDASFLAASLIAIGSASCLIAFVTCWIDRLVGKYLRQANHLPPTAMG